MQKKAFYRKLGKNVKKYRIQKGLSQEELADKVNLSLDFIGKIEIAYSKPSIDTIIDIANVFDISPKDLFDFEK